VLLGPLQLLVDLVELSHLFMRIQPLVLIPLVHLEEAQVEVVEDMPTIRLGRLVALAVSVAVVAVVALLPTTALPLVLVALAVPAQFTLSPIANPMITDSHNITWTPSEDRSLWTSSEGSRLLVNPASNDEQVLASIEQMYVPAAVIKTDEDRIAELEAQVKALLAKLS
jgi:hypothetical protein